MGKPIVVVGSINLDLVGRADRIPAPGETLTGSSFRTFFGGKGANQAVGAARLGHEVFMIGNVGDDAFGSQLKEGLRSAGVRTEAVTAVPGESGVALITTSTGGENSILVVPGANGKLTPEILEAKKEILAGAGILLAQLEVPLETVEFLAAFAENNRIPLVLDPAPAREIPKSLLERVTWFTPNETEAQFFLGSTEISETKSAANALRELGPANIILKLGERGCVFAEKNAPPVVVPPFAVAAVDSTAAGDAFNAAFAVGLMRGFDAAEAVRFACAVAAISVTRHGAQASMPTQAEVSAFLSGRN